MLHRLKPKSEFSRNVLTLMTGTTIAQAIPIAISPILTRLYTPEDFGVFALYMSISTIVGVIVTGQYELAIMLPTDKKDSVNILFLSLFLSFFISFIMFIVVYVFHQEIIAILNNQAIDKWLYFIPLSILLTGVLNSFSYWFNKNKCYKLLATTKTSQSAINSGNNLIFGFLKLNNMGFIVSSVISQLVVAVIFIVKFDFNNLKLINNKRIFLLAKRYQKFPKVTLPHAIFSNVSNSLPVLIMTKFFTTIDVGFYSFGNKIVSIPISLVGNAYYQVFFESFSKEKNKSIFYKQKFKQVNIIFSPFFLILWFILPDIFAFIFSAEWRVAGEYSQILLPLLYMKFLSNLFTTTTYIFYQKQEENFIFSIVITIFILISLMLGVYLNDIKTGLYFMVWSNITVILFKLYRSYCFVKEDGARSL